MDNVYRIKGVMNDIRYLEDLGLEADEILESILRDYAGCITNREIVAAFTKCGYTLNL